MFVLVRVVRGNEPWDINCPIPLAYCISQCMQWGEWVRTVGHWVVLVQVIYCSKGGWVLFLKNQWHPWEEILSYSHSHKPYLPISHLSVTHITENLLQIDMSYASEPETRMDELQQQGRWMNQKGRSNSLTSWGQLTILAIHTFGWNKLCTTCRPFFGKVNILLVTLAHVPCQTSILK